MNESAAPAIPYIPTGHPVRRFVIGVIVIAALLGIVWWSGIGRPQISAQLGYTNREAGHEGATITLTNDGPTTVKLRGASFEDPRLDGETVELPADALAGGETVEIELRFTAACTPTPSGGYYIPLRVTARTALAVDRTITAGDIAGIGDFVCGTDVADEVGVG
jgi:hypothetical protein